jgi:hypothetical protein
MAYEIKAAYLDIAMDLSLRAAPSALMAECAMHAQSYPSLAAEISKWLLTGHIKVVFQPDPFVYVGPRSVSKLIGTSAFSDVISSSTGQITLTALAGYEKYFVYSAADPSLGRFGPYQLASTQIDSWGALLMHEVSHLAGVAVADEKIANAIGGLFTDHGSKFSGTVTVPIK